jgi:hypothetical protein
MVLPVRDCPSQIFRACVASKYGRALPPLHKTGTQFAATRCGRNSQTDIGFDTSTLSLGFLRYNVHSDDRAPLNIKREIHYVGYRKFNGVETPSNPSVALTARSSVNRSSDFNRSS